MMRPGLAGAIAISTTLGWPYGQFYGGVREDARGWAERDAKRQPTPHDTERLSAAEAKRARKRAARLAQFAKAAGA